MVKILVGKPEKQSKKQFLIIVSLKEFLRCSVMDDSFEKFSLNFSNLSIAILNFLHSKPSLFFLFLFSKFCLSLAFFLLGRLLFQVFVWCEGNSIHRQRWLHSYCWKFYTDGRKTSLKNEIFLFTENAQGEPDYEMLDKFHEYQEKAEIYHLYHSIQRYTVSTSCCAVALWLLHMHKNHWLGAYSHLRLSLKELRHRDFSKSSFSVRLNLLHPQPSLFVFALESILCFFSSLANRYFLASNTLTAI